MIKKKIQKLRESRQLSRTLAYGFGEILLLVVGILIALQINNWNESRTQKKELHSILQTIKGDLTRDISEVEELITMYTTKAKQMDSIFKYEDQIKDNQKLRFYATNVNYDELHLNTRGIELLNNFKSQNSALQDSLLFSLSDFYSNFNNNNSSIVNMIKESVSNTLNLYRDNYSWYGDLISGRVTSEMIDDISSTIPRNHMINYGILTIQNYLPMLMRFKKEASLLAQQIP